MVLEDRSANFWTLFCCYVDFKTPETFHKMAASTETFYKMATSPETGDHTQSHKVSPKMSRTSIHCGGSTTGVGASGWLPRNLDALKPRSLSANNLLQNPLYSLNPFPSLL